MTAEDQDKPKIIVDDDWKSRAQAEKEQLQQQAAAQPSEAAGQPAQNAGQPEADAGNEALPEASFPVLVSMLATQAIAMLGQLPDPEFGSVVQLDHAKHLIDTLAVLENKTQGNLTAEEAGMLTNVLHELRMLYVEVKNQQSPNAGD